MSTYGRNFDFRVPPKSGERGGRYALDAAGAATVQIGAPVILKDGTSDASGRLYVAVADGDQAIPKSGMGGVMVYEYGPAAYAGYDTQITTYSDLGTAAAGAAVQVITGKQVKIVLKNTLATTFLQSRSYSAVKMVDETLGATPTLAVGDYLGPANSPSASNGYWQKTSTAANGWLVVVSIDATRGEVEARLNF